MQHSRFHATLNGAMLLVLFACLVPTVAAQIKRFNGSEDRRLTRVFYYSEAGGFKPEGQVSIGYGSPTWQESYDEKEEFDKQTRGRRWRLGSGMWTRLDTNLELDIGGTKVKPGGYYLLLERTKDDKMNLLIVDPATVRKQKLDVSQADMIKEVVRIPMAWDSQQESVEKLAIVLKADEKDPSKIAMEVRWGPHQLKVAIVAKL